MTRAEMQEHNRRKVIAAARAEFLARGFRDAKIDDIAERAELTRGAVYSNFPSKRALYLTVLAQDLSVPSPAITDAPRTAADALAAFARAWTARLPLIADTPRLDAELLPEIVVARSLHQPFAQLTQLAAITLGLTLEAFPDARDRMVRTAEAALTTLYGATQLSAAAPIFTDPIAVTAAVAHLARLDLGDGWPPPHLPFTDAAVPADDPWTPPPAVDALRDAPAPLTGDGVVAVLGLHRLAAVEEALRATSGPVTLVPVTADPAELGPLVRLCVADLAGCLRATVPMSGFPRLHVVHDETGALAAAAGIASPADGTEAAIRVSGGRIVARAHGFGACHAAASHS
ncbi:TetR/AcrR family transcriptional regulator [Catenuloplanes atrovinosus]|nr:TetR/AcrR family transcriptional regulator [Catenuloplanes atrovinosus]